MGTHWYVYFRRPGFAYWEYGWYFDNRWSARRFGKAAVRTRAGYCEYRLEQAGR